MTDIKVTRESRVYSPDSTHSFFADQILASMHDMIAANRLARHLREISVEVDSGSSEGRFALDEMCERLRGSVDAHESRDVVERKAHDTIGRAAYLAGSGEFRAATSTTLNGFTTPQYLVSEFARFRGTQRAFADQCNILDIPDVGLQVNVPRFTAAASAGAQSEGSSVSSIELDPTAQYTTENVQTIAGQVIISQQLGDRTLRMVDTLAQMGPAFDVVIVEELKQTYDQSFDVYVIGKTLQLANTVSGATSFTANALASMYADVATAHEQLTDTAGVRMQATHLFTTPDLYMYMSHQLDDQHRPIIVPSLAPGVPPLPVGDEDGGDENAKRWVQFTGSVVPGLLFWFIDPNLPTYTSSKTPLIVSRPDKILVFEGPLMTRVFPETIANNLQIVVQGYSYGACIPRYPGATSVITGAAYTTSLL